MHEGLMCICMYVCIDFHHHTRTQLTTTETKTMGSIAYFCWVLLTALVVLFGLTFAWFENKVFQGGDTMQLANFFVGFFICAAESARLSPFDEVTTLIAMYTGLGSIIQLGFTLLLGYSFRAAIMVSVGAIVTAVLLSTTASNWVSNTFTTIFPSDIIS